MESIVVNFLDQRTKTASQKALLLVRLSEERTARRRADEARKDASADYRSYRHDFKWTRVPKYLWLALVTVYHEIKVERKETELRKTHEAIECFDNREHNEFMAECRHLGARV